MNRAELTVSGKKKNGDIIDQGNCFLSNLNGLILLETGCFVGTQGQYYTPLP